MEIIFLIIRLPFFLIGFILITAFCIVSFPFWVGYRFIVQSLLLILILVPIKFFESAFANNFDILTSYIRAAMKKWKGEIVEGWKDVIRIYSKFITKGSYIIVEDTCINGHPVRPDFGPGPWEAVEEFLKTHPNFKPDLKREKFLMTLNPRGYLRRVE